MEKEGGGWESNDVSKWREAVKCYKTQLEQYYSNNFKPNSNSNSNSNLVSLDDFYNNKLPVIITTRNPNPYITKHELSTLMQWKLTRGKWRPRLLDFVSSLDETLVKSVSERAFKALSEDNDISKAVKELTVLKGVGPATASAVLAAYAPHIAPFMSDEAMVAALGHSKDYTLKQYLLLVDKLQAKAKELSAEGEVFTPSDVEKALWSWAVGSKLSTSSQQPNPKANINNSGKKKRKR